MDSELARVLRSHARAVEDKNDELDAARARIAELTGALERADGELVHRHNRIAELVTALHNVKRMASSGC